MLGSSLFELKITKESTSYLIGLIMGLLVGISILLLAEEPSEFGFSITCGALTFLIFVFLYRSKDQAAGRQFNFNDIFGSRVSHKFIFFVLYLVCILIALFIPSATDSQFISWLDIKLLNYVRLFAGILLSSILPGYGLLELIDRKHHFKGLALLVSSFFISVFLMGIVSFISFLFNWGLTSVFWLGVIVNAAIFVCYSISQLKNVALDSENKEPLINLRIEYLIIACIFLFFIVGWVAYYSSYQLGSTGDMWDHYYTVMRVAKGGLFSSSHLSYLNAETWFSFHFLTLFQLTGFPSLNGWMIYAFINFFFILAFYLMVRAIVGEAHPRVPIISTVIASLFAGFGWLVVTSYNMFRFPNLLGVSSDGGNLLTVAGNATYNDIIYSFIYGPIPQYFSLSVLFVLIYLMFRKGDFSIASGVLTVFLVAEGLLIHSPEIVFFVLFYYIFLIFAKSENFARLKRFNISILIGLLTVFIVGLPFPSHFYFNMNVLLPALFLAFALTFLRFQFKDFRLKSFGFSIPKYFSVLAVCVLWALYIVSFFAWNSTIVQGLDIFGELGAVGLKPWYIYPVNSGISLLLGLLGLTYLVLSNQTKLEHSKFLAISLLSVFIAGIIISFANVNLIGNGTYWEKRLYGSFMIIPVSIFGAFFITELFSKLHFRQTIGKAKRPFFAILSGFLILIIVLSGVGSNVLALDFTSIAAQTDPLAILNYSELEIKGLIQGLDYLRANTSANSVVLGLSAASNRLGYVFSGSNHLNSVYWLSNPPLQYIDTANPELFLKTLYSLGIDYLFVMKGENLSSTGFLGSGLIDYLPVDFHNNETAIYSVPKMNPPSAESSLTLVVPEYMLNDTRISNAGVPANRTFNAANFTFNPSNFTFNPANRTFNLPIDMLSQSGLDYCLKFSGDESVFNSSFIVLSSDKGWSSEQINRYLSWVQSGGNLVVLNGDGLGSFAKIISINSKPNGTVLVNKACSDRSIVNLGNMSVSSLYSRDNETKVLANYVDRSNQSVPLAFSKEEGKGEIIYLDVNPLFDVLNSANGTSWSYFKEMGGLFNLLSLNTPVFQNTPDDTRWKYIGYDSTFVRDYVQLVGSIDVASNSIIIPYNKYNAGTLTLTNTSGTIDGLLISQRLVLQNVNISILSAMGGLNATIHSDPDLNDLEAATRIELRSTNYGSYSCMLLRGNITISLQIPPEGISFSVNSTRGKENVINLQSGNLLLQNLTAYLPSSIISDNGTFVLCRTPSISIWGRTIFSQTYVPNYIKSVTDERVQNDGAVVFKFDCSSDSVIVLNDFGYHEQFPGDFKIGPTDSIIPPASDMAYWEIGALYSDSILYLSLFITCIVVVVLLILVIQPFYQVKIGKGSLSIEGQPKKDV